MTLPTATVTAKVLSPTGSPIVGAVLIAELTVDDVYKGIIVPRVVRAYSNMSGSISVKLFPNKLGVNGSLYNIHIQHRSFGAVRYDGMAIPNVTTVALEQLLGGTAPDAGEIEIVLGGLTVSGGQMVIGSGFLLIG